MKCCIAIVGLIVLSAPVSLQGASTNPVGKAIELLSGLEGKILKEGAEAQKAYAEFAEFCEETSANLQYDIKTGKGEVAELKAAIDSEAAKIASLNTKIEDLA